jgi:hypothetical protein
VEVVVMDQRERGGRVFGESEGGFEVDELCT